MNSEGPILRPSIAPWSADEAAGRFVPRKPEGSLRNPPKTLKMRVFARDEGICQLCAKTVSFRDATLDRIVPGAMGGRYVLDNVQIACRPCNQRKGADLVPKFAYRHEGTPIPKPRRWFRRRFTIPWLKGQLVITLDYRPQLASVPEPVLSRKAELQDQAMLYYLPADGSRVPFAQLRAHFQSPDCPTGKMRFDEFNESMRRLRRAGRIEQTQAGLRRKL